MSGKDGKPATFSKDNVPYKPKHWLKVATEGIKPGDLVFVAGYPGRTQRHQTYAQVKETTEWAMPRSIRLAQEQLAILDQLSKQDKAHRAEGCRAGAGLEQQPNESEGHAGGTGEGREPRPRNRRRKKSSRRGSRPTRRARRNMATCCPRCARCRRKSEKTREQSDALMSLAGSSSYLGAAESLYRLSVERPKADIDRESGFQERNWPRIRDGQERMQRTMDSTVDRALLGWALGLAAGLPADQRIAAVDQAAGLRPGMAKAEADKAIDAYVQRFAGGHRSWAIAISALGLIEKSTAELVATKDPFILLAAAMEPLAEANREAAKNRGRRAGAPGAALYGSPAGQDGRPGGSGREQHPASDLSAR